MRKVVVLSLLAAFVVVFAALAGLTAEAAKPKQSGKTTRMAPEEAPYKPSGVAKMSPAAYEVKGYSVQTNFDLSTTRIPTSFSIVFSPDKANPDHGQCWMNRTPEAVAAVTQLLDKAFAENKRVYFDPSIDALGIGVNPDPILIGPKKVVPSN